MTDIRHGDQTRALSEASRIAAEVLLPAAMAVESSQLIPAPHLDALADAGLYGLAGPGEYGGIDADARTVCGVIEVLAGACLSTAFVWLQHHGAVRAVAAADAALREEWLGPLCHGARRAGVAFGGAVPGPPRLRARPVADGYVFDGESPWVTGWGYIDTLHTAARDADDNVVWALLDARPGATLVVEPLETVAVMASGTVRALFSGQRVPRERVTGIVPLSAWVERDASGLRANGSLALGVAAQCCRLIGPSALDDELAAARDGLDAGTAATMPAARSAASELALRAAAALVVSRGSTAILLDHDAQRLAREALFLLVFGSRPPIRESLGGLLTSRGPRR